MIRIKLQDDRGKLKYIRKSDGFPIEVGENIRFDGSGCGKAWKVVSITALQKKK